MNIADEDMIASEADSSEHEMLYLLSGWFLTPQYFSSSNIEQLIEWYQKNGIFLTQSEIDKFCSIEYLPKDLKNWVENHGYIFLGEYGRKWAYYTTFPRPGTHS